MKSPAISVFIAITCILLVQSSKANKELPRSLEEMQSSSAIVLDGKVTAVMAKHKPPLAKKSDDEVVPEEYEAKFEIERTLKGPVRSQSVVLVYSRISDPRFSGDNPPALRVGDHFRLFADKIESDGPPIVIRVRTENAVRPEAVEQTGNASPTAFHAKSSDDAVRPIAPLTPQKTPNNGVALTQSSEAPASSIPWSLLIVIIVPVLGLLWLFFKRHS